MEHKSGLPGMERGIVTGEEDGLYIVASYDRPGIIAYIGDIGGVTVDTGTEVYFTCFPDGGGRILGPVSGRWIPEIPVIPAMPKILTGTVMVSTAAAGTAQATVTFPEEFSSVPVVMTNPATSNPSIRASACLSRTVRSCVIAVYANAKADVNVQWLAVGT